MDHSIQQVFLQVRLQSGRWTADVGAITDAVSQIDLVEIADWFSAPEDRLLLQCNPWNLFFHPLPTGHFALGIIYKIRQRFLPFLQQSNTLNVRVLIISPQTLSAFQNHPIALFESLRQQNLIPLIAAPPQQLLPIRSGEPAVLIHLPLLETLAKYPGTMSLAQLMQSLFNAECTFFSSGSFPTISVFTVLLDLLPVSYRPELTFSTNLFFSLNNTFRLSGFSGLRKRAVQFVKQAGIPVLFLEQENKGSVETLDPWARFVYLLLQSRNFVFWQQYLHRDYHYELNVSGAAEPLPVLWSNLHETGVVLSKAILSGILPNQFILATDTPVRSLEELRCIAAVDQTIPSASVPRRKDSKSTNQQRLAERFPQFRAELIAFESYLVRGIFGDETVLPKIRRTWSQLRSQLDRESKEIIQEETVTTIHAVLMSFDDESGQRLIRSTWLLELMLFFIQENDI